ncbi:MAG TPA: MotA/TolQ/ExbB proton channel family protein [candidate division Zixibacteria bacterium]|nr:MotA/TolQ/ExbB proton channel family protein [candidate division Zixibacteria bacterium]
MLRAIIVGIAVSGAIAMVAAAWPELIDFPSLAITLGGAAGVTFLSYSRRQLGDLAWAAASLLDKGQPSVYEHARELARLTHLYRLEGLRGLENQERYLADAFLRKTVGMLVDLHREEQIRSNLQQALAEAVRRYESARQVLMTLGRLLPSFGLIGTLAGMVSLLKNLTGPDPDSLPPALGLAVLTTFYGAVLANVLVAPLAARLHHVAVETEGRMRLTLDWATGILRGEGGLPSTGKAVWAVSGLGSGPQRAWLPIALPARR